MIGLVVDLFIADFGVRGIRVMPHEVADALYLNIPEGRNDIDVLETTVEYGNGHALPSEPNVVQPIAMQAFNLFLAHSVAFMLHRVPCVEIVVVFLPTQTFVDRVGRYPHQLCLADERELLERVDRHRVVRAHDNSIVPTAFAYNLYVYLTPDDFKVTG